MRERIKNALKTGFLPLLLTCFMLLLGAYYVWRHSKPFTQNAFVFANTRPVSALVEGYLAEIHVKNNQRVRKGDKLFTIFKPPYLLKVKELESAVEAVSAKADSLRSAVRVIRAEIDSEKARLANAVYLSQSAEQMYSQLAISRTYAEERRRDMESRRASLAAVESRLEVVRAELRGAEAEKKRLSHQLELAKIYYELSVLTALSDGYVINMYLTTGGYYRPGDVFCAFVDDSEWFVQANFEETDLSLIRPGMKANIYLWQYPGKCFPGVVDSIHWGAERRLLSPTGAAEVKKENQWFLLPQRFPVVIRFLETDPDFPLHLGGSAYVEIECSSQFFRQIWWRIYQCQW